MNKMIIMVLIGVVVIGGGVWYITRAPGSADDTLLSNSNATPEDGTPSDSQATPTQAGRTKTSMRALIDSRISQKCVFADTTDASNSAGTVYVANGNLRGDFISTAAGQTIQSHMILAGNAGYVWDETTNTGMKMPIANIQGASSASGQGDITKEVEYSCEPWSPDSSKFSPPSNISFTDISAMMEGLPGGR